MVFPFRCFYNFLLGFFLNPLKILLILIGLVKRFFLCENQAYFRNEPSVFGCDRNHYITGIKQMFQTSLLYESESSVRTAAVRAYVAFLTENEDDDRLIKSLSDQIPAVIKVNYFILYVYIYEFYIFLILGL